MAKLLVFDDDTSENKKLLQASLSTDHETTFVSSAEQTFAHLEKEKYDAVIANIFQAEENVLGLLHRAKMGFWLGRVPFIGLRGPDSSSLAHIDDTVGTAMMFLGARGYIAADDYDSIGSKLESILRQLQGNKKPSAAKKRKGKSGRIVTTKQ